MRNKKAFSFVELVIVVSIIILLSVVIVSINNNMKARTINSRVEADLQTLGSSLNTYLLAKKELPLPAGNLNFFNSSGTYIHDDFVDGKISNPETFGVYGKITENSLPKSYSDIIPVDPRTGEYYAFGVTKDQKEYEIAGVLSKNDYFVAKVVGNYKAENGVYNLIREYNGADFVKDGGSNLPYNPHKKTLIATDENGKVYREGDTIKTGTSETKYLYFSDGSVSRIEPNTTLVLTKMQFPKENKIITKIKLTLDAGVIWTKATKLFGDGVDENSSQFSISSGDTTAAVRGTVFKIEKAGTNPTKVTVISGKVNVTTKNDSTKNLDLTSGKEAIISNESIVNKGETNETIPGDWLEGNSFNNGSKKLTELDKKIKEQETKKLENKSCRFAFKDIANGETLTGYTEKDTDGKCNQKLIKCENGELKQQDGSNWIEKDLAYKFSNCIKDEVDCITLSKLGGVGNDCIEVDEGLTNNGYKLVAYAPYDKAGDLKMYKENVAINANHDNIIFTKESGADSQEKDFPANICSVKKDSYNSFCEMSSGVKGILIDNADNNSGGKDKLAYDISSLNLGDNWAIEINARVLNHNSHGENYILSSSNGFYLFKQDQKIILTYPCSGDEKIDTANFNNNFQSFILKKENGKIKVYIDGDKKISKTCNNKIGNDIYIGANNYLNISGKITTSEQWNDIVNYVKIYKKIN